VRLGVGVHGAHADRRVDAGAGIDDAVPIVAPLVAIGCSLARIVPAHEGESDAIAKDESKNLIVCPLPYDRSFMQVFYQAWEVVVQFLASDAQVPREANLPRPPSRQVARYLEDRRAFPVEDVIEALEPLSQPHLLRTQETAAEITEQRSRRTETSLLAPMPQEVGGR